MTIVSSSDQLDLDLHGLLPLHLVLVFFLIIPHWPYTGILSTLEAKTDWWRPCAFLFWGQGRGRACKWKNFPLGQMQTGDFSLGVRIGVEDAKSLDLLHGFSLIVQTCLSFFFFFFFFFFFAFKLLHSAHGEMQWQKLADRKSRNSQIHHSEYSFLQRKNKWTIC